MTTTLIEPDAPPPAPRYGLPDAMRVRCLIPVFQSWSDTHALPGYGLVEVDHLWMTAARWGRYPGAITATWRARRVFGFVVAHRVRG